MLTYNQFRSKLKNLGVPQKQRPKLWSKYKTGEINDSDLTKTRIKKFITTINPKHIKRVSLIRRRSVTKKPINIDFLSQQPVEIAKTILFEVPVKDIMGVCSISKHFKEKVCTDYFWKQYIDEKWKNKRDAFILAYRKGNISVAKILLKYSQLNPASDNNSAIRLAAKNGHSEVVKMLLKDPRVNPAAKNNYAIQFAAGNGNVETVKLLLKDPRVDPSVNNNFAFSNAAGNGHFEVAKELLKDSRVNPNEKEAIRIAIEFDHPEMVKLILNNIFKNKNFLYKTAIFLVKKRALDIIEMYS